MMNIYTAYVFLGAILFLLIVMIIVLRSMTCRLKETNEKLNRIGTECVALYRRVDRILTIFHRVDANVYKIRNDLTDLKKSVEEALEEEDEEENSEISIHLITKEQFEKELDQYFKCPLEYDPKTDELYQRLPSFIKECARRVIDKGLREEMIGDALKYFGVCSKCDKTVYVRNHDLNVDYHITRV